MIVVAAHFFPLLAERADPAIELILSYLTVHHLASFLPLFAAAAKNKYTLRSKTLRECVRRTPNWKLTAPDLNYKLITELANRDCYLLVKIISNLQSWVDHKNKSLGLNCYSRIADIYPICQRSTVNYRTQSPHVLQLEFNPIALLLAVVFAETRYKKSLIVYSLADSKLASAPTLLIYSDEDKCDCGKVNTFMSASWSPNGKLLLVYESKDRENPSFGLNLTLFVAEPNQIRRIELDFPLMGRVNLLQRQSSCLFSLWDEDSNLYVPLALGSGEQMAKFKFEFFSDGSVAKATKSTIELAPNPEWENGGDLKFENCNFYTAPSKLKKITQFTPYCYWLLDSKLLITCEQCSGFGHQLHSNLSLKKIDKDSENEVCDEIAFPFHRVHDGSVHSENKREILLLLGSSASCWRSKSPVGTVQFSKSNRDSKYRCKANQDWLGKEIDFGVYFHLLSLSPYDSSVKLICQTREPLSDVMYNHTCSLTIVAQTVSDVVARFCCRDSPDTSKFYVFSKLGDMTRKFDINNFEYLASPHDDLYLRFKEHRYPLQAVKKMCFDPSRKNFQFEESDECKRCKKLKTCENDNSIPCIKYEK